MPQSLSKVRPAPWPSLTSVRPLPLTAGHSSQEQIASAEAAGNRAATTGSDQKPSALSTGLRGQTSWHRKRSKFENFYIWMWILNEILLEGFLSWIFIQQKILRAEGKHFLVWLSKDNACFDLYEWFVKCDTKYIFETLNIARRRRAKFFRKCYYVCKTMCTVVELNKICCFLNCL